MLTNKKKKKTENEYNNMYILYIYKKCIMLMQYISKIIDFLTL